MFQTHVSPKRSGVGRVDLIADAAPLGRYGAIDRYVREPIPGLFSLLIKSLLTRT